MTYDEIPLSISHFYKLTKGSYYVESFTRIFKFWEKNDNFPVVYDPFNNQINWATPLLAQCCRSTMGRNHVLVGGSVEPKLGTSKWISAVTSDDEKWIFEKWQFPPIPFVYEDGVKPEMGHQF